MASKETKVEPGDSKAESGEITTGTQNEKKGKSGSKLGKLVRSSSFKLGKKEKVKEVDVGEPDVEGKKKQKKVKKSKKGSSDNLSKPPDGAGEEVAKPKSSKASQLVRKLSIGKIYKSGKSSKPPSPTQGSPVMLKDNVREQEENVRTEFSTSVGRRQGPEGDDFQSFRNDEDASAISPSADADGQSATGDVGSQARMTPPPVPASPLPTTEPRSGSQVADPAEEQPGVAAVRLDASSEAGIHSRIPYIEESDEVPYVDASENRRIHYIEERDEVLYVDASEDRRIPCIGEIDEVAYVDASEDRPSSDLSETVSDELTVASSRDAVSHPEFESAEETRVKTELYCIEESVKDQLASAEETGSPQELPHEVFPVGEPEDQQITTDNSITQFESISTQNELSNLETEVSVGTKRNSEPVISPVTVTEIVEEAESNLHPEVDYKGTGLTPQVYQNLQQNKDQEINKVVRFESDDIEGTDLTSEHESDEVTDPVVEVISANNFEQVADNGEILEIDRSSAWMSQIPLDHPSRSQSSLVKGKQSVSKTAAPETTKKNLEEDIAKLLEEDRLSSERVLRSIEESLDKSTHPVNSQESEEIEEFGDNLDTENSEAECNISVPSEMPSSSVGIPKDVNAVAQQSGDKREHLYKILVIGELGTGKTSIIKRYVHQFFSQHYRATIGVDFALKVLNWDTNSIIRLQLWDIAGQERFGNMTRVYYKEAVGAFIVFDVTRAATFDAVVKWKQDLDTKVQLPDGSPIPCVLLANKCDQQKEGLVNNPAKMEEYCKEKGFVGWYETSAKENINIEEAAKMLVTKILQNDKLIHQNDTLKDSDKFSIDGKNSSEKSGKSCSC